MSEETTAPSGSPARTGDGWIANLAARLARVGADPGDDEDLRQKKALLFLLAVLIAPISAVWGTLYLAFGSAVGIAPFVYLAISVASLLVFARTKNFRFLLLVQLLDILIAPTVGGQMLVGGFLPSGAEINGRRRSGLELRIGINSGPVVAGVIGTKRFLYDLWGDAVNVASRMETNGTPGEIQITRATYELLEDGFVCRRRGTIRVKGKGEMETWYLVRSRSDGAPTESERLEEAGTVDPA